MSVSSTRLFLLRWWVTYVVLLLFVVTSSVASSNCTICLIGQTCCTLGNGQPACCPLAEAVCCIDYSHCCPNGTVCDNLVGGCFIKSSSMTTTEKQTEVKIRSHSPTCSYQDEISCIDQETHQLLGCCPSSHGTCCPQQKLCCPNGYSCSSSGCIVALKKMLIP